MPKVLDISAIISVFSPWLNDQDLPSKPQNRVSAVVEPLSIKQQAPENVIIEADNAFDLSKYALNQGSAELAALMAEEYLLELEQQIEALFSLCESQRYDDAAKNILAIIKIAKIMAAKDLLVCSEQIEQQLIQQQYREVAEQLSALKAEQLRLTECVEAI